MKNLFLILILFAYTAHSQIVVKETSKDSTVWKSKNATLPKLIHFYNDERNWYTLYYKNLEYQHITDIDYINLGLKENTIDFFNILKQSLEEKKQVNFELSDKLWFVHTNSNIVSLSSSGTTFFLFKDDVNNILDLLK
jgi:hypothetical protein